MSRRGGAGATLFCRAEPGLFPVSGIRRPGLAPVGYGYRSVEAIARAAVAVEQAGSLEERRRALKTIDETGLVATPDNSGFNEFVVVGAGRLSLLHDGREAMIDYKTESVQLRG